jgi:hypothetical protein
MRCYSIKPCAGDYWPDENPIKGLTVYERDGWRQTGLLDAGGNALYATDMRSGAGFVALKERNV